MNEEIKKSSILNVPNLMEQPDIQPLEVYNDDLIVIDFSRRNRKLFSQSHIPSRIAAFSLIMVCSGECTVHLDYIPYRLQPNMFILLKDNQLLSKFSMTDNFTGYHLVVDRDFLRVSLGKKTPPVKEVLERSSLQPVIIAPENDFARLTGFMHQLINHIYLTDHLYQRDLIQNTLCSFIIELWNITASVSTEDMDENRSLTLHQELTLHFLHLVHQHCKETRDVSYYATQLCVTPVYLTRIVKQLTGKTATKCISDIVSSEAKLLLHQSGISVQQIAEELRFSDQAAFSKFFKKNNGMSPLDYRRKLGVW